MNHRQKTTTSNEPVTFNAQSRSKRRKTIKSNLIPGTLSKESLNKIFNNIQLGRRNVFLDLGHGDGQAVIHAVSSRKCKAQGIELDESRFMESLKKLNSLPLPLQRKINLYNNSFEDKEMKEVIMSSDIIFVNNAEEIFGGRMNNKNGYTLDLFIASTFSTMDKGTVMITLTQMLSLGSDITETNKKRKRANLDPHENASYFTYEKMKLPLEAASWAPDKEYFAHIYKKTGLKPRRLCTNRHCKRNASFQDAVKPSKDNHPMIIDQCMTCKTNFNCERTK